MPFIEKAPLLSDTVNSVCVESPPSGVTDTVAFWSGLLPAVVSVSEPLIAPLFCENERVVNKARLTTNKNRYLPIYKSITNCLLKYAAAGSCHTLPGTSGKFRLQ